MENTDNTSTPVETVEPTETAEATTEVAEEVAGETTTEQTIEELEAELMSIDELLKLNEEDYPEFEDDANHKGMKPLHHWMQHMPEDVRKHVANMRASYTRKTQAIAEQRKELENLKQELLNQKDLAVNNPVIKQMQQYAETENDVYTEAGLQAEIKKQAALMMQEMMKPAQQQIQLEQRQMELQRFKSEHPDLTSDELRKPIAQMLVERPELKLEDAYYIVKSKYETQKALIAQEEAKRTKQTRRETFQKTSTGKSVSPSGTPQFRSAWEAFQYHKNNKAAK
jgi:hypothetical protein